MTYFQMGIDNGRIWFYNKCKGGARMGVDKRKGCCFFTEFYGNDLAIVSFGHQDFATVQAYKFWRQGEEVSLHLVLKGKGTLTLGVNKYRIS